MVSTPNPIHLNQAGGVLAAQAGGFFFGSAMAIALGTSAAGTTLAAVSAMTAAWFGLLTFRHLTSRRLGLSRSSLVVQGCAQVALLAFCALEFRADNIRRAPVSLTPLPELSLRDLASGQAGATDMERWMEEQIGAKGHPSLNIAVANRAGLLFSHLAGEHGADAGDAAPLYPVASVTKTITATMALVLEEEGRFSLEEPLTKHLPEGAVVTTSMESGRTITLGMLATHTSGLVRGIDRPMRERGDSYDGFLPERLMEELRASPPRFPPGSDRGYSNLAYGALGHVLERASGEKFEALLESRITAPLGLGDTSILDYTDPEITRRLVTPHEVGTGSPVLPSTDLSERLVGSGGAVSTASDLARFGAALLSAEALSLSEERHRSLFEPTHLLDESGEPGEVIGQSVVGTVRERGEAGTCLSKNGGRDGASAFLIICPEIGLSVAVTSNRLVDSFEGSVDDIGVRIVNRLAGSE